MFLSCQQSCIDLTSQACRTTYGPDKVPQTRSYCSIRLPRVGQDRNKCYWSVPIVLVGEGDASLTWLKRKANAHAFHNTAHNQDPQRRIPVEQTFEPPTNTPDNKPGNDDKLIKSCSRHYLTGDQ